MRAPVAAALAVLLATCAHAQVAATASVERAGDSIVFEGRIDGPAVAAFLRLLPDTAVRRLVITSAGGLVGPALQMAEAVRRAGLDVEVPQSCLSSCANYVFPAGRHKLLGHPEAVGWHGNMAHVLYLAQSGQAQWSAAELADAYRLARTEAQLYLDLGVDGFVCWFGKLPPYDVPDFYALAPADMARFGIPDVQVLGPALPPRPDLRMLAPDPATLEAIRPSVRLVPDAQESAPR